jgi:large repetitive protein
MLGVVDINTSPGDTINSGSVGIFAFNQGSTVPQADHSSIAISNYAAINSGSNRTGSGSEPGGIGAGFLGTTGTPTPTTTVFGNVNINNDANINAAAGWGIDAFIWGVGNILVSDDAGTTITATAAGATTAGFAQYGIVADNYESGDISIAADAGSTIDSGSVGINAINHATAISAAAGSTVTIVALGAINSGVNAGNSGSAPAGIVAGFNPGSGDVFSANVNGSVNVNLGGSIIAAAGDGIRAYDYGVGDVTVDLGYGASITATTSATTTSGGNAPYGVGAFNFGPGDTAVTTSSCDIITSGSSGIEAIDQAAAVAAAADALVTVSAAGTINSGAILTDSGSLPSGISAGFLGGTSATPNLSVNGTVLVNNDANITAAAGAGIQAFNYGNGNVTVNDSSGTTIIGAEYGIAGYTESGGTGNLAINIYSGSNITGTSNDGILAYSTDVGNISVITASGDIIGAGSAGIDAVNEAATIAASANSSIVVSAYGTINSGPALTGVGTPPGGILAGYLGDSTIPTAFPLTSLNGNVVVNNFANINAAAGDGIRAFNFGIGNVTVNDEAGSIILGGSDPINGYEDGINATNEGSGNIHVSTAAGIVIDSIDGGSGIVALNKAPAPSPGSAFSIPSTSFVSVLAYGTIESGNAVLTGSGDPAAGILAGYDPNNTDTVNGNVHGNVSIDDYASILAPAGTDGIRGINYGTGTVTIIAEAGATITAGRYGIGAFGYDGGDVSVTNYATVTGSTVAINATTTSAGTVIIDNYGHLTGDVSSYNATFSNEAAAGWSLNGISAFTGTSNLVNDGAIQSNGTSEISGLFSITNSGTIEPQAGRCHLGDGCAHY